MPYLLDRQRALASARIVAILSVRQRKVRSRVIMSDNSLYHTLTRPQTLVRAGREPLNKRLRTRRAR